MESAFEFFATHKPAQDLENNFEVLQMVVSMLSASSSMVFMDYWTFAKIHGPNLPFVEAIIKARDDFDRPQVNEIMETLKRKVKEEGIGEPAEPTIMVRPIRSCSDFTDNVGQDPSIFRWVVGKSYQLCWNICPRPDKQYRELQTLEIG